MTTFLEAMATARINLETPLIENDTAHFESFGRFIVAYANTEAAVHMLARRLSGLDDAKARAIFSGMRISDVLNTIRVMVRADKLDTSTTDEIAVCFSQLNVITEKRNNMIHRGLTVSDRGQIQVTNISSAKSLRNFQFETFSLLDIESMRADCMALKIRLSLIADDNPENEFPMTENVRALVFEPWRYTPAKRGPQSKQPRKAQKLPQRQPRSSQT